MTSPLFLDSPFFSASSLNPKHSKQRIEDATGDNTAKEHDGPSITVDPSTGSGEVTLGQMPPPSGTDAMMTNAVASPLPAPPMSGKKASTSALSAAPAPRVLKKKVLSIKKSNL